MKKYALTFLFMLVTATLMAQSGNSVAADISSFYKKFVRPVLIAWVVIQGAIGGVMANNKVRKSGEEASDAMMGWFKMIIFPVAVLGVAEIGNALYD